MESRPFRGSNAEEPQSSRPAREATWRNGYAEDCKSLYPGSIPGVASSLTVVRCCARKPRRDADPKPNLSRNRDARGPEPTQAHP